MTHPFIRLTTIDPNEDPIHVRATSIDTVQVGPDCTYVNVRGLTFALKVKDSPASVLSMIEQAD